jgi:hypothetical protein
MTNAMEDARRIFENRMIVSLAGKVAARRALQGGESGWVRHRRPAELTAIHESAHAVVATLLGSVVFRVYLVDPASGRRISGACEYGIASEQPAVEPSDDELETDNRQAARAAMALTLTLGESDLPTWRLALREFRECRAKTVELVEAHWRRIEELGWQIERRGSLSGSEVNAILGLRTQI